MQYNRVYIDSIGYELPPVVVTTRELEARLKPLYDKHRLPAGQLELLTGINERRWWKPGHRLSTGATDAARHALSQSNVNAKDIDILIYAGVCREQYEPATACAVAANLGISSDATVYDLSNACLGVLNGIIEVANRIELGQAKAGLVVSCESAREINDIIIDQVNEAGSLDVFRQSLATFTGGSGAVAVLVTSPEMASGERHRLLGGANKNAPEHNGLCKWGVRSILPTPVGKLLDANISGAVEHVLGTQVASLVQRGLGLGARHLTMPFMETHAGDVLKHGVELGKRTWDSFLAKLGWNSDRVDKVICHQVGAGHRDAVLRGFGIPEAKDFSTFNYLGNIGTVSLPLTAALASERDFLQKGDHVGWLGIGSGLNCLMLGLEW